MHNWYQKASIHQTSSLEFFDWDLLEERQLQPPWRPRIMHMRDLSNFRAADNDMPPMVPYRNPGTNWDRGF